MYSDLVRTRFAGLHSMTSQESMTLETHIGGEFSRGWVVSSNTVRSFSFGKSYRVEEIPMGLWLWKLPNGDRQPISTNQNVFFERLPAAGFSRRSIHKHISNVNGLESNFLKASSRMRSTILAIMVWRSAYWWCNFTNTLDTWSAWPLTAAKGWKFYILSVAGGIQIEYAVL